MAVFSASTTRSEVFDRSRLLIDLDEATDPASPPTLLLVFGFHGPSGPLEEAAEMQAIDSLTRLRDRFAAVVGEGGATYRTRKTELCAIIDGFYAASDDLLEAIGAELELESEAIGAAVAMGIVELPDEAPDAITALTIADRRLKGAAAAARALPA